MAYQTDRDLVSSFPFPLGKALDVYILLSAKISPRTAVRSHFSNAGDHVARFLWMN